MDQNSNLITVATCVKRHEQSCKNILQVLGSITPKDDESNIKNSISRLNISDLLQQASNQFLSVKYNQRAASLLLEQKMEQVRKKKAKIEAGRLTLQNLAYQRDHLTKEIAHCEDYCTTHLDQMITAIKIPTSAKNASDERNDSENIKYCKEKDDLIRVKSDFFRDPDRHDASLEILNFQIKERLRLVTELKASLSQLTLLERQKEEKENFAKDILRKVEQIEKATFPIQNYFKTGFSTSNPMSIGSTFAAITNSNTNSNISFESSSGYLTNKRKRYERAAQLPGPLYTLCCQLEALVDIQKNHESNGKQHKDDDTRLLDKVCISVDVATSVPCLASTLRENEISEDQEFFYQTYPSTVLLHLKLDSTASSSSPISSSATTETTKGLKSAIETITICFQYMTQLNIVTAAVIKNKDSSSEKKTESSLNHFTLYNLFPNDNGLDTPYTSNYHLTSPAGKKFTGLPSFTTMAARPYLWAQWLSGINLLPSSNQESLTEENNKRKRENFLQPSTTAAIVRQLKRRLLSNAVLGQLLTKLGKIPNPVPTHPDLDFSVFPSTTTYEKNSPVSSIGGKMNSGKENIQLKSWKELDTMEDSERIRHLFSMKDRMDSFAKNRYFAATLQPSTHLSNIASLEAFVEIGPEYPISIPLWRLRRVTKQIPTTSTNISNTFLSDNNLKAIEKRVNVDCVLELVDANNLDETFAWILVHQLRMIISCWSASHSNVQGEMKKIKRGRDRRSQRGFERYGRGL